MRTEVNILGSLEVTVDGTSVVPSAGKVRQLLALLAIKAGSTVGVGTLTEELWEHRPPRTASTTLQTYVMQLRRRVAVGLAGTEDCTAKDILTTNQTGYLLDTEPESIDAVRYGRKAAAGRAAFHDGDAEAAAELLADALTMWRGGVLLDVPKGPHLSIESVRLEQDRLSDLSMRIDADLRLGRHCQLLGELAGLCARHPMMEAFHGHYMLALYRSGRRWQAAETYQRLRETMASQLNVDPSPRIRELHESVLRNDRRIDDVAATEPLMPLAS